MTPTQRKNLSRLLRPRHIAFIGGSDAETALRSCQRIGYEGAIWAVSHKRKTLGNVNCYDSVEALPEAPDAVFLAIPAEPALETVKWLASHDAGGIVCYTAGFGADGKEGGASDQPLIDAAGDMALIGPNCYGLINFIDRVALWPFAHGGFNPGYGAAIITQSGMLSSDITMNQRSLPLAYMISAGNQSVLQLEDYIDVLCEFETVKAIGLHVEGLKDIESFSRAALKALEYEKPIVVLKTGTSKIGSQLTISHTGSLSGANELYQALFDRLGIISVNSPTQLLETLKLICVSGIPRGNRLMGFTCSGGGATMLADHAEQIDLEFPQPTSNTAVKLEGQLPAIADVTNPLDYTTPIWGIADKLTPVFKTALGDNYDAAIIVQDYPLPDCDESKPSYLSDAGSFMSAVAAAGIPGIVCATIAENIDQQTRKYLIENKVTPAQGIHETLDALAAAIRYGKQRPFALNQLSNRFLINNKIGEEFQLDEWAAKTELKSAGINIPCGKLIKASDVVSDPEFIDYPAVLKLNSAEVAHKTEIGAVAIGLNNSHDVEQAMKKMQTDISHARPELMAEDFLLEEMLPTPVAELMVNVRHDDQFGMVLTISSGGIFIELFNDAITLILPAQDTEITNALDQLRISKILKGYRGAEAIDEETLVTTIQQLIDYMTLNQDRVAEVEINPLFVYIDQVYAVDVLTQLYRTNPEQT